MAVPKSNAQIEADLVEHRAKTGVLSAIRRLLAGIVGVGGADHRDDATTPSEMPHVDSTTGSLLVGTNDHPKRPWPPFAIFDYPKQYVLRLISTVAAVVPGNGNRAAFVRLIANPPTSTTERGWATQMSADVPPGNSSNMGCGYANHPDLMGCEASVYHSGTGIIDMVAALFGVVSCNNGGAGRIKDAVSVFAFQPQADDPGSIIDRAYCIKAIPRSGGGTVTKKFSVVAEDGCGPGGIGYSEPLSDWTVKGGISAGRNEDAGTGYVHAEAGFKTREGGSTHTGVTGTFTTTDGKTITVKNGIVTSIV